MCQFTVALESKRVKIDELEQLTGQPRRNIRFLIAEQVVPEPYSRGRGASYGPEHVRALALYGEMKAQGITSLDVIRERIRLADEAGPLVVVPAAGVEVRIERQILQETGVDRLVEQISEAVRKAASHTKDGGK
jgi:hypothetical protein